MSIRNITTNTKRLLKSGDFSLTQFQHVSGVSRRTLGRILSAKGNSYSPTEQTLNKLASVAGVTAKTFSTSKVGA